MARDDDFALVKCARCSEFIQVPWELLGDTNPRDITDYICDSCEDNLDFCDDDEEMWWEDDEDFEDDPLEDMCPLEF